MTVAELIQELQAYPAAKQVKVMLSSVAMVDEMGDHEIGLNDDDAMDADRVLSMGSHVLIRSR